MEKRAATDGGDALALARPRRHVAQLLAADDLNMDVEATGVGVSGCRVSHIEVEKWVP